MVIFFVCLVPLWFCSPARRFGITWMASCKGPITCLLDCGEVYYELAAIHMFFFFINTYRHPIRQSGDWSFPLWVVLLTSYDIPLRSELSAGDMHMYMLSSLSHERKKCVTHVYTSLFQPLVRRTQLGNWPNTYAMTSEVREQDIGKTTRRWDDLFHWQSGYKSIPKLREAPKI